MINTLKKISVKILLSIFVICALFSVVLFGAAKAKAAESAFPSDGTLEINDGISLKLNEDGGMRFVVKMNKTAYDFVKTNDTDNTVSLVVLIAPQKAFDKYTDYAIRAENFIKITIDESTLFSVGGYYYANACVISMLEANRNYAYTAAAYIVSGETAVKESALNENAAGSFYAVTNQAVLTTDSAEEILSLSSYSWLGTETFPIYVKSLERYNSLVKKINSGLDFADKNIEIHNFDMTGKTELDEGKNLPETVVYRIDHPAIDLGVTVTDSVATVNAGELDLTSVYTGSAEAILTIGENVYKDVAVTNGKISLAGVIPASIYGQQSIAVKIIDGESTYNFDINALVVTKSIATEADLRGISAIEKALDGNGYYKLANDIIMSAKLTDALIGKDKAFVGTIDGNGQKVVGLTIESTNSICGFIYQFGEGGVLKNIAFVDAEFNLKGGFITNSTGGTLENVYISVKKFANQGQGNHGLFGPAWQDHTSTMKNVIVDYTEATTIDVENDNSTLFGKFIVGSKFTNVAVIGIPKSLKGSDYEGKGVKDYYISYTDGTDNGVTLPDSGWNRNYWIMSEGSLPTFKGILKKQSITVDDVVADLNVNAEDDVATMYMAKINLGLNLGNIAVAKSLTIDGTEYSEWGYDNGELIIGELPATLYGNKTIVFNVETNTIAYTVTVNALFVTKSIATEADLQSISAIETALGGKGYYRLTDNITMSETGWYATYWDGTNKVEVVTSDYTIGLGHDFVGTIDGDGHKIVGFTIRSTNNKTSFVSQLGAGGTIKNIAFIDAAFKQKGSFVSAAANEEKAVRLIENVYIGIKTYDTTGQSYHGLFGVSTSGYTMKNVIVDYTTATITGLDKTKTKEVYLFGNFGWWTTFSNVAVIGVPAEYSDYVCKVNVNKGSVYVAYDDNTTNDVTLPDSGWDTNYWTMTAGSLPTFKSKEN